MHYLGTDFDGCEKPKGGPLEIENFFVEGVNERGWKGGQEPSKPPPPTFFQQKIQNRKCAHR